MRRWTAGVVMVVVLFGAGGCGVFSPGGDLSAAAAAAGRVKLPGPEPGACYQRDYQVQDPKALTPHSVEQVDCSARHMSETVYVGEFTGADAERSDRPADTSAVIRRAYARCVSGARAYLGADWRTGRLALVLHPPTGIDWAQGYRYYRCDVSQMADDTDSSLVTRTGSLRDGLRGRRPVAITCARVRWALGHKYIEAMGMVGCGTAHDAEFVGLAPSPDVPWPSQKERDSFASAACDKLVGRYLGAGASNFAYIYGWADKDDWELGDKGYRCWVETPGHLIHASVKGIGSAPLPR